MILYEWSEYEITFSHVFFAQTNFETMNLSDRIRNARKSCNLSQDELGKALGVSDKTISAYEKGRATPPITKLVKIAQITSFPLSYFTEEENNDQVIAAKLAHIEQLFVEVKNLCTAKSVK